MYRVFLLMTALLLSACATEWHVRQRENSKAALRLQSVRNSTLPENGLVFIQPSDLRAGDILFSSEGSIRSLGIRVFSNAAVSHSFIYLGDGQIAEAVGSGTRIHPLADALQETNLTVAFRRPDLTAENIQAIIAFAEEKNGSGYNHLGIALQAPFALARNACELPVIPRAMPVPERARHHRPRCQAAIHRASTMHALAMKHQLPSPTTLRARTPNRFSGCLRCCG